MLLRKKNDFKPDFCGKGGKHLDIRKFGSVNYVGSLYLLKRKETALNNSKIIDGSGITCTVIFIDSGC